MGVPALVSLIGAKSLGTPDNSAHKLFMVCLSSDSTLPPASSSSSRWAAQAHLLHARHHHKMYDSEYFSLHKTKRLQPVDFALGRAEDLDAAIAARSFKNEIIILVFTKHSVRWMVHYARMAQALGYDHFAVVGSEEGDCSLFEETWCSTQFGGPGPVPDAPDNATAAAAVMCRQAYPGCAWISATESEDGQYEWQHMQQRPVERLWLFRYIFAYECIQRGVNILISDLDVVLHGDFYIPVKTPPMAEHHFFQMPGSLWPNGGLLYIQNAHKQGPISYMFNESVHLGLAIYRHRHAEPADIGMKTLAGYCSGNDQDTLEAAMLAAALNGTINHWKCLRRMKSEGVYESDFKARWAATFAGLRPMPEPLNGTTQLEWLPYPELVQRDKLKKMGTAEIIRLRPVMPAHAERACAGEAQCSRLAAYCHHLLNLPPRTTSVWNPPEALERGMPAMSEVAVSSPEYLLGTAEPIVYGWTDPHPQRSWGLSNHLVAFGPSFGWTQTLRKAGGRNNRLHILQAHGQWFAPLPLPKRMLRVSPMLVEAAAAQPTSEPFRRLIRSLMVASALTGRKPVLPAVRCGSASWIQRNERARHGYADPSFITTTAPWAVASDAEGHAAVTGEQESEAALCTPYLSFWDECTDAVVLSDFHLHQELLAASFSEARVVLSLEGDDAGRAAAMGTEAGTGTGAEQRGGRETTPARRLMEATAGAEAEAGAAAGAAPLPSAPVFEQLRRANVDPLRGGARVLWLAGDLDAALSLTADPAEMKGNLKPKELADLNRTCVVCPDFAYEVKFLLYYGAALVA